jgi:AcrR family transcriptional regulator
MPPKTADIDKKLKREHFVTSAAQVFAARGYHNATMDEIAQVAGAAKGTLYLYFKDKESLFYAVFEWLTAVTLERSTIVEREHMSTPDAFFEPLIRGMCATTHRAATQGDSI